MWFLQLLWILPWRAAHEATLNLRDRGCDTPSHQHPSPLHSNNISECSLSVIISIIHFSWFLLLLNFMFLFHLWNWNSDQLLSSSIKKRNQKQSKSWENTGKDDSRWPSSICANCRHPCQQVALACVHHLEWEAQSCGDTNCWKNREN